MIKYSQRLKDYSQRKKHSYFSHKPNRKLELMDVDVRTNELGLRDDPVIVNKKHIAILGDSLTFGWGVEKDKTFEALLEESWKPTYQLLNLGHCNFNTEQQLDLYQTLERENSFDGAILFYFINDVEKNESLATPPLWTYSHFLVLLASRFKIFFSNKSFIEYYSDLYKGKAWPETLKNIIEFSNKLKRENKSFSVVLLPELHQLSPYLFSDIYKRVKNDLSEAGIEVYDSTQAFSHVAEPMSLWVARDDAHPNAKAHKIIADFVRKKMELRD